MAERIHLTSLSQGRRVERQLAGGTHLSARKLRGPDIDHSLTPRHTSYHEGGHLLMSLILGVSVFRATKVPGPGYSGATWVAPTSTRRFALIAAAAEALGCDGTGHDLYSIAAMGEDPGSAVSAARALLSGRRKELLAIATAIETKGTITGADGKSAQLAARADTVVEVSTTGKGGAKFVTHQKVRDGETFLIPVTHPLQGK